MVKAINRVASPLVMKAKSKAKSKGKAAAKPAATKPVIPKKKIKQEAVSPKSKRAEDSDIEVTPKDQSMFKTWIVRNQSDKSAQLLQEYESYQRNDPRKKELIAKWKLDKTLQWVTTYEEGHQEGKKMSNKMQIGWATRPAVFPLFVDFSYFPDVMTLSTYQSLCTHGPRTHNMNLPRTLSGHAATAPQAQSFQHPRGHNMKLHSPQTYNMQPQHHLSAFTNQQAAPIATTTQNPPLQHKPPSPTMITDHKQPTSHQAAKTN